MPENNQELYDDIQPSDHSEPEEAVENNIAAKAREREYELQKEMEARARELLRSTYAAFIGMTDYDPDERLSKLQAYLEAAPALEVALDPDNDALDDVHKRNYRKLARRRNRWRNGDDITLPLKAELVTYVAVMKAVRYIHASNDFTRMAPVTLEKLTIEGARSPIEGEPTPIGRRRVGAGSTRDLEEAAVEIPLVDCEHLMVIANPRAGKDALLARIGGNLKDEHGYKWVSLHDDGRNETPMIAIPNDEDPIRESLARFGQEPKGYPTKVYVPAVDLPDRLPKNFKPFTFGVDDLTPEIIGHLSGVSPSGDVERRIKHALRDADGDVDELIRLLNQYADDTSIEVTVTGLREDFDDANTADDIESETQTYELGAEDVLRDCSQSLMELASEGLLQDRGAETNLDVVDMLADQEHVAVLNCNEVPEYLKMLIENVWLQLISEARDEAPWLPRVAIEMREIKQLAPSVLERTKYSTIAKSLRQTVFHLSSQGGSRRIMMLGSTQYLKDVYLPVRGNMPLKVLLEMGPEKISVLENAGFSLSDDEKKQIRGFQTGWGMAMTSGGREWPINWSGPRCGLGLGDLPWHSRYGRSMGFRVDSENWEVGSTVESWRHDSEHFIDQYGDRQAAPPDRGEWYLLPADLEAVDADALEEGDELVLVAAAARRDYTPPQDLRYQEVDVAVEQREIELLPTSEAEARQDSQVYQTHGVDGVLRKWTNRHESTVEKMTMILEAVDEHPITKYVDIEDQTGISEDSIKKYANAEDMLGPCMEKTGGHYRLTLIGKKAIEVPWRTVFSELE